MPDASELKIMGNMVLTAVSGAYQRKDGVYVAPINLLKP